MWIVFDTEDDSKELLEAGKSGFDKRVTQIAAMTAEGKRYYNKGDVRDFLRWLRQQPERFIYAHNIQYDLGNLFGKELDVLDCTLVGGRMIKAVWGNKCFVDSFNLWPMALKKLALAFDTEKLETDSMATDTAYVWRDVEILHAAMMFAWQFTTMLGIKILPPTLGGLCVKIWKHWQGENCHDSLELSREALFGGRVELFKTCNESEYVCYTDVNSLYPAMLQRDFPGVLEDYETKLAPHGIARVTVKVPQTELPLLPYRSQDGRITYPYGQFTGTWTMPELQELEQSGGKIIKVHQCYGTAEVSQPYREFTDRLYKARLASNSGAEKLFFKLLMNNLYGRLGTTGKIGRTVYRNERNEHDGVPFGEKVLVSYSMPLSEETNWSHAAYVTAYGRLELLKYLRKIGAANLIYCDTDSAIFDVPSPQFNLQFSQSPRPGAITCGTTSIGFATGTDLGAMKLESWETCCRTYAPKMYQAGNHWKAKGVPQRLAREFIEKGVVQYDLPFKYREAVAFFDRDNVKRLSVWRKVEKRAVSGYDRKKLLGKRFFPCKLSAILPN